MLLVIGVTPVSPFRRILRKGYEPAKLPSLMGLRVGLSGFHKVGMKHQCYL